jgi:lipid A 3-O-deacylase
MLKKVARHGLRQCAFAAAAFGVVGSALADPTHSGDYAGLADPAGQALQLAQADPAMQPSQNAQAGQAAQVGGTASTAPVGSVATAAPPAPRANQAGPWGIQLGVGRSNHGGNKTHKGDLGIVWDPGFHFVELGGWHFTLLAEAHLAEWHPTTGTHTNNITEFGAGPVLRFEKESGMVRPFVEWGEGLRVLSHARVSDSYTLSTAFQFADMLGVGLKFGQTGQYQAGFRFQHLSNASIKRPNPGINFEQIYLQYNF